MTSALNSGMKFFVFVSPSDSPISEIGLYHNLDLESGLKKPMVVHLLNRATFPIEGR